MGKRSQVFVAPGKDEALPINPSPWHRGRWVYLPLESWEAILDAAETINPQLFKKLLRASNSTLDDDYDTIVITETDSRELILFLKQIKSFFQQIDEEQLDSLSLKHDADRFIREEYYSMIDAIITVIKESIRLKEHFRAWTD